MSRFFETSEVAISRMLSYKNGARTESKASSDMKSLKKYYSDVWETVMLIN